MSQAIQNMIDKSDFTHNYQLIFDVSSQRPFGFEILFRSYHFNNPETAFHEAFQSDLLYSLEITSINKAITQIDSCILETDKSFKIFINIFSSTILHNDLLPAMESIIANTNITPDKIVFEITEHDKTVDDALFIQATERLKKRGFHIAIDDLGKSGSSLKRVIDLNPSYIKLDKFFANGLNQSFAKQTMIQSLMSFCHEQDTTLIVEGIEQPDEWYIAKQIGVTNAQGFLLSRPDTLQRAMESLRIPL
ncbi:EAL domain-containing protein (putative c-di-GMP-specific phosphodiesterase class I) [Alkalibacillus flavidus]|uniref:EAL domain-containing protein (Putative c-di-GMP-specific phosphodiesterase class I) n=1 Tax=Alkalibacillus flavidus TaxID=546021 RepID=A0ABV2KUM8_9BACI